MEIVPRLATGMWVIALSACATHQQAPFSSTEGTTIVRSGVVTNIRDVTTRDEHTTGVGGALSAGVMGDRIEKSSHGSMSITEMSVRFDNGDIRTYNVDSTESFRIGERVTVAARNGIAQVTRQ